MGQSLEYNDFSSKYTRINVIFVAFFCFTTADSTISSIIDKETTTVTMTSKIENVCTDEEKLILQSVFKNYDKSILPNPKGVTVDVEMHIQDISSLSELTSDFELDVLFSSIWRDPHLSFENLQTCETNLTLDLTYLKRIWLPKTCVINSKRAEVGVNITVTRNNGFIEYKNYT